MNIDCPANALVILAMLLAIMVVLYWQLSHQYNLGLNIEVYDYLTTKFLLKFLRAPDKVGVFIYIMPISSPNPMFDHLLESSHRDNSNKRSNIGFGTEITQVVSIEVNFRLVWSSVIHKSKMSKILYFSVGIECQG